MNDKAVAAGNDVVFDQWAHESDILRRLILYTSQGNRWLLKFYYFGHGGGFGNLAITQGKGLGLITPGRYTHYGIAGLYLYGCDTAEPQGGALPYIALGGTPQVVPSGAVGNSEWRYNVSPYGVFAGYLGSVDLLSGTPLSAGGLQAPPSVNVQILPPSELGLP